MLILSLDTCLARCAVCLFDSVAGRTLAEEHQDMERGHAEALAPMVKRVLSKAQKSAKDLQRVVVTTGPGTFTGVRIGLSFARALGLARNIAVYGLDTLQSLQLNPDAPNEVAFTIGKSGLAYVLTRGKQEIQQMPMDQLAGISLVSGTPNLQRLAAWAALQPHSNEMPKPVYVRTPDAKPQIVIRRAGAESAVALAALHKATFPQHWTAEDFTAMFSVRSTQAFTAEIASEAAGFILTRSILDQAELISIATLVPQRKLGVAAKLLGSAMADAKQRGAAQMFLEVAERNTSAVQLYSKLGFVKTGLRKAYYADGDNAVLMARSLV